MTPADTLPEHPMLAVRRRVANRQRVPFEPVYVPGETRRGLASRFAMLALRAALIAAILTLFLFSAVSCAALLGGV